MGLAGLALAVLIGSAISGLGIAADKFLLPSERLRISDVLTDSWIRISDLSPSRVVSAVARIYLATEARSFGHRKWSFRWILSISALSIAATMMGILIGDYLFFDSNLGVTLDYLRVNPFRLATLAVNLIADILTILITVYLLRIVATASLPHG